MVADYIESEILKNASIDKWDFHFNKAGRWWDKNTEIDIDRLTTQYYYM